MRILNDLPTEKGILKKLVMYHNFLLARIKNESEPSISCKDRIPYCYVVNVLSVLSGFSLLFPPVLDDCFLTFMITELQLRYYSFCNILVVYFQHELRLRVVDMATMENLKLFGKYCH